VAVSGGADSTALLALAVATGRPVTAYHVDHGLRPGGPDEAAQVARCCASLGAGFVALEAELEAGPNLEARARAARRALLPRGVATGHTMDDQAETLLINLVRGAGATGLKAMVPGAAHPLLGLRRSETRGLCAALGLPWFEDPTNTSPRFVRNRIRHEVLPLLGAVAERDVVPLLARSAALLGDDDALLDAMAEEVVPDPSSAPAVRAAPVPLARRRLRGWLTEAGGYPPSLAEVDRVRAVAAGEVVATELGRGRRVGRHRGVLMVERPSSGTLPGVLDDPTPPAWAAHELGDAVVSPAALAARVAELGAQITADYHDDPPLLVGVLKGAMQFMADLCRQIELPVDLDFMAVSSYGSATQTSGIVRIVKDLEADLTDRHVLVVEDIVDSGLTLNYLRKYLLARKPRSVEVCALLIKQGEQRVPLDLRYVGFAIPPTFVVGYGLDVAERYRNLNGIYTFTGEA